MSAAEHEAGANQHRSQPADHERRRQTRA
jgi:hypothetical protein